MIIYTECSDAVAEGSIYVHRSEVGTSTCNVIQKIQIHISGSIKNTEHLVDHGSSSLLSMAYREIS